MNIEPAKYNNNDKYPGIFYVCLMQISFQKFDDDNY